MLYLGIDQHKRQLTVNLRGEDGSVILKRQVSTEWEKVRTFFADLAEKARPEGGFLAILEVCGMNPWLLDMLQEYGCRETVVIQPTERSKQKTDRRDAGALSHLLWVHRQQFLAGKHPLGLRRVQPPTPQQADDRQITTLRARLTKKRTAVLNGIHKLLRKHNLEQACPTKVFQTQKVRRWLAALELPALDRAEMDLLLPQWDMLDQQLEIVEGKIAERAVADEQAQLLQSIPGIGHYSALAIAARIGDIARFKRPDSLANYFGLTPGCRNSGSHAAVGLDHQAGQQDRPLPAGASRGQGAAFRRGDAHLVQADQETSRREDCPRRGDAPPDDDHVAHAHEETEIPLRVTDQEAPGIRGL
jgi:transposase